MDPKVKLIVDAVVGNLLRANVELPIIIATITGMVGAFKAAFGTGPSFPEVMSLLEAQVAANQAFYVKAKAELEAMTVP